VPNAEEEAAPSAQWLAQAHAFYLDVIELVARKAKKAVTIKKATTTSVQGRPVKLASKLLGTLREFRSHGSARNSAWPLARRA
jgi:hypothetical protein